jgi:hypothetical protein
VSIGAWLTRGVGDGVATAVCDPAADGAAELGLGDAAELHAPTRIARRPRIVTVLVGPERVWNIAGLLLCG